jgi:hypothetical protein
VVNRFDERVIIIKGWSVTLSLAALAWGFQFTHYGLFLVACVSGVGFWIIDALMKRHQIRYYARRREIEVFCARQTVSPTLLSTPQIDWSWERAPQYFRARVHQLPPGTRAPVGTVHIAGHGFLAGTSLYHTSSALWPAYCSFCWLLQVRSDRCPGEDITHNDPWCNVPADCNRMMWTARSSQRYDLVGGAVGSLRGCR